MHELRFLLKQKINIELVILQVMMLLMSIITCLVHNMNFVVGIVFFIFQLLGVFIPGFAASLLAKIECENNLVLCTWSYALGLIVLVIEYFLLVPFNLSDFMPLLSVLVTIGSVMVIWKNNYKIQVNNNRKDGIFCICLVAIVMLIGLFTVSFVNSLPSETGGKSYYVDWLYWIGNNISLAKGFPAQDYRLVGEIFNYHYFSSILIAGISLITKIDIVILSFYYSYFIPAILLVFSGYTLFSKLLSRKIYIYVGMILLLFAEGTTITYIWHVYFCPFGYDYGHIFGMLAVAVLVKMVRSGKYEIKNVCLGAVLLGMTTGCKGPVGVVILIGYGIVSLSLLLQKKWKQGLGYGILWLGAFLFVYLVFISGAGASIDASAGLKFLGLKEAWHQNRWAQEIYSTLLQKYDVVESRILKYVSLWLYNYRANKSAIMLLIVGIFSCGYNCIKRKINLCSFILVSIGIWGVLLTNITNQLGGSQMYFVMSIIPYGILVGLMTIEDIDKESKILLNMGMCLVIITGYSGLTIGWGDFIIPKAVEGVRVVWNKGENYSKADGSMADYEAYDWIKRNIPEDSYIAWDCFQDSEGRITNQVAGVFTERFIWNDGKYSVNEDEVMRRKDLVNSLFEGNSESLERLYNEGVHYFVQTVAVNPDFEIDEELAKCIYENNRFKIYKICVYDRLE